MHASSSVRWSSLERGTAYLPDEHRAKARSALRARRLTVSVVACVVLAVWLNGRLAAAVDAAARRAILRKEPCAPLRGWLPACVLVDDAGAPTLLLKPRYARDDAAAELVRVRESSELCPAQRSVIRQRRVNVTHGWSSVAALEGKTGACVMHLADAFRARGCAI